jgi:hypothetical protein
VRNSKESLDPSGNEWLAAPPDVAYGDDFFEDKIIAEGAPLFHALWEGPLGISHGRVGEVASGRLSYSAVRKNDLALAGKKMLTRRSRARSVA